MSRRRQEIIPRDAPVNALLEDGPPLGPDAAIEEYGRLSEQEIDEDETRAPVGADPAEA